MIPGSEGEYRPGRLSHCKFRNSEPAASRVSRKTGNPACGGMRGTLSDKFTLTSPQPLSSIEERGCACHSNHRPAACIPLVREIAYREKPRED